MQQEIQTPRRSSMPVLCPSCGEIVSASAPTCTVCGYVNPTASNNLAASRDAFAPPHEARSCAACAAPLGPGSKFCRTCGEAVGPRVLPNPEPARESAISMPHPAPEPPAHPRAVRRIVLPHLDDLDEDDDLPPVSKLHDSLDYDLPSLSEPNGPLDYDLPSVSKSNDPLDYLDSQLGLKAPKKGPVVSKPPAWRSAREHGGAEETHAEESHPPPPATRAPVAPHRSDAPAFLVQVAIGFAAFAILIAMLIHLVAPTSLPGYSAAELDFKMQLRAIEWLLAGILVALVGLLLKR